MTSRDRHRCQEPAPRDTHFTKPELGLRVKVRVGSQFIRRTGTRQRSPLCPGNTYRKRKWRTWPDPSHAHRKWRPISEGRPLGRRKPVLLKLMDVAVDYETAETATVSNTADTRRYCLLLCTKDISGGHVDVGN